MVSSGFDTEVHPSISSLNAATRNSLTIHWSGVFAGIFVGSLGYLILMSLGVALGAGEMRDILRGVDGSEGLGTIAGIWTLASITISLFVGCYASSRVSGVIATRVGYTQGAVVSSIFFALILVQTAVTLNLVSKGIGATASTIFGSASNIAANPRVANLTDDALSQLKLNDSPPQVASGVISRLLQGDRESAIGYLSREANLSRQDAQNRLETLDSQLHATLNDIGQKAAVGARAVGLMAFVSMFVGTLFGMLGGGVGAQLNIRRPLSRMDSQRSVVGTRPVYT